MIAVRIDVTQADIDQGMCDRCPIELAVGRLDVLGVQVQAAVGARLLEINFLVNGRRLDHILFRMPTDAIEFVLRFDNFGKEKVEPFDFLVLLDDRFREYFDPAAIVEGAAL